VFTRKPNPIAHNLLKYQRIEPESRASLQARWNRPVLWPMGLAIIAVAAFIMPAVVAHRRREQRTAASAVTGG
jgi:hypothetical protein